MAAPPVSASGPIGVQRRGHRTAAFFDLDKTIIAKSSTLAFSRPFQAGGLISRRAVLRSAYAQFVYLVGGADHDQMEKMREFMSQLCAGWDVATVKDIVADTLHNIVDPIVYDEAVSLIEEHHLAGRDVIIVSTSGSEVVAPIGEMLGADRVIATRMEVVDGKYTGDIDYYAYGRDQGRGDHRAGRPATATTCRAATPTATRSPTCPCSRRSATRTRSTPTRSCVAIAAGRGWPVLVFSKPVTLRQPGAAPGRPADARGPCRRRAWWSSAARSWSTSASAARRSEPGAPPCLETLTVSDVNP